MTRSLVPRRSVKEVPLLSPKLVSREVSGLSRERPMSSPPAEASPPPKPMMRILPSGSWVTPAVSVNPSRGRMTPVPPNVGLTPPMVRVGMTTVGVVTVMPADAETNALLVSFDSCTTSVESSRTTKW